MSPRAERLQLSSYEPCQATASGRFLQCIENPYYNPGGDYDPRAYRGSPRKIGLSVPALKRATAAASLAPAQLTRERELTDIKETCLLARQIKEGPKPERRTPCERQFGR